MTRWTRLRGKVISQLVSERGSRLAARLRGSHPPIVAFLQLADPRSLLMAQVLHDWQQAGLELEIVCVGDADRAYDPQPQLRRQNDQREAPLLANAFGLRWEPAWHRPGAPRVAQAHAQLRAQSEISAASYLAVAEAAWGSEAEPPPAESCSAGEVALWLERGRGRLLSSGHYMAPVLSIAGDPYFGVMRLASAAERLREAGRLVMAPRLQRAAGIAAPETRPKTLTVFHSFRSPYAYLGLEQAAELAQRQALELKLKPVLPMVMRGLQVPLAKRLYIVRDVAREARRRGIAFGLIADPLGPGIGRCMALFSHAQQHNKEVALCLSLGRGIWSQALDVCDDADMALMVERAGLHWPQARAVFGEDAWRAQTEAHRRELIDLGLWGVPSYAIDEQVFWGQDRLPLIDAWLADAR